MKTLLLEYKEEVSDVKLRDAPSCDGFKVYGDRVYASYGYLTVTYE